MYGPEPVGALIADNTISVATGVGMDVGYASSAGVDPIIRNNTISGAGTGINVGGHDAQPVIEGNHLLENGTGLAVRAGASAMITGNELIDNEIAISVASDAVLDGNDIRGGKVGILLLGGSPALKDNTIEGVERGLVVGLGTTPTLVGNTICGNVTNLDVSERAEAPDLTGNEVCPDAPAEASE